MPRRLIVEKLEPGDVIFQKGHALMYVGKNEDVHEVIDADKKNGVTRRRIEIDGTDSNVVGVYRCKKPELIQKALTYARSWAKPADDPLHTRYGRLETGADGKRLTDAAGRLILDSRATGVVEESDKAMAPPYEADAFYRSVKWASRIGDKTIQMSKGRGTTCAALLAGCYQAAALNIALEGDKNGIDSLHRHYETLKDRRNPKLEGDTLKNYGIDIPAKADGSGQGKIKMFRPLRTFVNNGFKGMEDMEYMDVWREIIPESKPEDVMTQGMMVDAQFVYTPRLMENLDKDRVGWSSLTDEATMEFEQQMAANAPTPPPPPTL